MALDDRIKSAEDRTNVSPTEKQKKAGNYKKGKFTINGLRIVIENPIGSTRSGCDANGDAWDIEVKNTYGYFSNTRGKDGDPVDVYLGSDPANGSIFIIDQMDPVSKTFDEHKVMFGFNSSEEAENAYKANFNDDWHGMGNISRIDFKSFKSWLYNTKMTTRPFSKMKSMKGAKAVSADNSTRHVKMFGEVIEDETLCDLMEQAGDLYLCSTLVLEISSPGGSVVEGLRIMLWLENLANEGVEVVTVVSANAYSIASLIMLVAHHRIISTHGQVMVHNPMVPLLEFANADELEYHVDGLRKLESMMRNLYISFTGIDEVSIKDIMSKETFISPTEAVELGFADEVVEMKKKSYSMTSNNHAVRHKIINMSKTLNILNRVIALVDGSDFVNQSYSTLSGSDIEIYQKDPAKYGTEDRTNVEQGVFTLADGAMITIEDYVITDISNEVSTDEVSTDEVASEPQVGDQPSDEPMAVVEAEPVAVAEPIEAEPVAEFNEGAAPIEEKAAIAEPVVEKPVAEEVVITPVTPAPIEQAPGEKEELISMVKEMQTTISGLQKKIAELVQEKVEASVSSLDSKMVAINSKITEIEEFNGVAATTLEHLAKNTVSQFKPSPKVVQTPTASGSIFQRAKLAAKEAKK